MAESTLMRGAWLTYIQAAVAVAVAVAAAALGAGTARAELPADIQRVVTALGVPAERFSIVVQAVGDDAPLLSHLPDEPRHPASVMKLVTTWAALEALGPAYTWPTEVYFAGPFNGRELGGDLVLKGHGDPFLVQERVWLMLRTLRQTGLEDVQGDLIVDASYFDIDEADPGAFDGEPYRTYNVVPNALLVNFKAMQFRFTVDRSANRVRITTDPVLGNINVRNELTLASGSCGGYQRGIAFSHADAEALDRVVFSGGYPRTCGDYTMSRTVLEHDTYALGLFTSLWREIGGKFAGDVRSEPVPADAQRVLTWQSPPLGEVIRSINKNSNNVMTRQLLYTLGAERFGPPGTKANGIAAIAEVLAARGIDTQALKLDNGAGLSRDERVSARLLTDLLLKAERSPYGAEFVASLSLGGEDGTTRGRFSSGPDGVLHVKTGRIDHVSALAGYVHGDDGRTAVIAIMVNAPEAHRGPGQEIEEAVVAWVQRQLAARRR